MKKLLLILATTMLAITISSQANIPKPTQEVKYPGAITSAGKLICRAYAAYDFTTKEKTATLSELDNAYFMYDISDEGKTLTNQKAVPLVYNYSGTNKEGYMTYGGKENTYINIGERTPGSITTYKFIIALPDTNIAFVGKCLLK